MAPPYSSEKNIRRCPVTQLLWYQFPSHGLVNPLIWFSDTFQRCRALGSNPRPCDYEAIFLTIWPWWLEFLCNISIANPSIFGSMLKMTSHMPHFVLALSSIFWRFCSGPEKIWGYTVLRIKLNYVGGSWPVTPPPPPPPLTTGLNKLLRSFIMRMLFGWQILFKVFWTISVNNIIKIS